MKKYYKLWLIIFLIVLFLVVSLIMIYFSFISPVSNNKSLKEIVIPAKTTSKDIGGILSKNKIIKNEKFFVIYLKINKINDLKAGTYQLSESMGLKEIIQILQKGNSYNDQTIKITFKEGINFREFAKVVADNTNNSYNEVIKFTSLENTEYLNSLIEDYWFITDDILNKNIYYPLEGYLYPNTYRFTNKDVTVMEIFSKMLDETDNKLSKYKKEIESSSLSIHELITLSSIIELEGAKADDRRGVAGVFYNRLSSSSYPTLGSDATTYYASKIDDWSQSLTYKELNDCSNKYNTRCSTNTGLPVGPICNPSIESIEAAIKPEKHKYYYFVADCKGKVYLTENETEHYNIINKLKREKNWCA